MEEKRKISAYEKLIEGINEIINTGKYEQFLKFVKKFHKYSFNNRILIFSQKPDATRVAGYCTWKELGRGVKSNPTKIFILRPIMYQMKKSKKEKLESIEERDNEEEIKLLTGFKWTIVYDISDTYVIDEKKATNTFEDTKLNSNNSQELYNILYQISPVDVFIEKIYNGSDGYYSKSSKKIVISSSLSLDDRTATLIHEITHALYDDFDYSKERNLSEMFVESVAYITADYFGLDTSKCSFPYITSWSEGDTKELIKLGNKIEETSNKLIDKIEEQILKDKEKVA